MTAKHTPTPWKVDQLGSIRDADNKALTDNPVDNAFIVRAVNVHEELLEALRKIVRYNGSSGGPKALIAEFKFIAEQAIAKAEGR